jgi:hypothetical protein
VTVCTFCRNYILTEKVEFAVKQLVLLDGEYFLWEEFPLSVKEQSVDRSVPVNLVDPFL